MGLRTKDMILCAVFAAILCVFSAIAIPIGTVPVTLGVFGVLLAGIILGWRKGVLAVAVFILLGCVGLPVFGGARGGVQVLTGPTGGYITGYIGMVLLVGRIAELVRARSSKLTMLYLFLACVGGVIICYLLGTLQFMVVADKRFQQAMALCVYPFILPDLAKAAIAAGVGYSIRQRVGRLV